MERLFKMTVDEKIKMLLNKSNYGVEDLVTIVDNVGADKGGAVNMFDDFDIDYNKETYLIETRISGALTVPVYIYFFIVCYFLF